MHVSGFEPDRSSAREGRQAQPPGDAVRADHAASSRGRAEGGHAHDSDADVADISPAAVAAANKAHEVPADAPDKPADSTEGKAVGEPLTQEEQKQVQELKDRDRETRTHEQAHKNAAGSFAQGGPVFEYQQGPDGRRYAVGGHVNIDTSAVPGDPQATIQKMQVVRRAALAPSNPSEQDRKVAAQASQAQQKARAELRQSREEETGDTDERGEQKRASAADSGSLLDVTV